MKHPRTLFLLCWISLCPLTLAAQSTPREIPEKFFSLYRTNPAEAVDYLFGTNPWISSESIQDLRQKVSNVSSIVGPYKGYEPFNESKVGRSLIMISYLVRHEKQPLRFTFVLYRPENQWRIQNFEYDDNLTDELAEADAVPPH